MSEFDVVHHISFGTCDLGRARLTQVANMGPKTKAASAAGGAASPKKPKTSGGAESHGVVRVGFQGKEGAFSDVVRVSRFLFQKGCRPLDLARDH